jgi:lipoate-protein ligase A
MIATQPLPSETWRLLPCDVGSSLDHFARSDALSRVCEEPTVWWHATERPTLIVGAGQRLTPAAVQRARERGVLVVRRQAGGTSVYAASGVLGLDVMLPAGHRLALSDVVESYRWLGETWLAALERLGVAARIVSVRDAREAETPPADVADAMRAACFGTLSPYELTAGGRKLVGLAQVRRRAGVLLQSAVHLHFDAHTLAWLLSDDTPAELEARLHRAAAGLDELAPAAMSESAVMDAFASALRDKQNVRLRAGMWSPEELEYVERARTDATAPAQ